MKEMRNRKKRSQVTVFVIVAILIVGLIILFFSLRNKSDSTTISPKDNPQGYIQDCAEKALVSAEKLLISHSGFANITDYTYNGSAIAYLCYTSQDYTLCTDKHPALSNQIAGEAYSQINPKVQKCFDTVKDEFKNYNYQEGNLNITIEIAPKKISAKIDKKIAYTIQDKTTTLENFDVAINSPLYAFVSLTNNIINQELTCDCGKESCNADLSKLNLANRDYKIIKPVYSGSGTEVYSITEILSGKQFNFAIRNCVLGAVRP